MTDIISSLATRAPEMFFGALLIAALWIAFREYRRITVDIKENIQTEVAAQLGRTMGDLRISSEEAGRIQQEIRTMHAEIQRASEEFDARVSAQEQDLNSKFQHLRERVAKYERSLPEEEDDAKVPASLVSNALERASSWAEAAGLVDTLASDPDSTSRDLEFAGDRSRQFGQYTRAMELYDLSRKKDPERETVAIEYLALKAEQSFEGREEALEEATAVVLAHPSEVIIVRLANTFIELDRYEKLRDLCEALLTQDTVLGDSAMAGLCHRNLGVAYKELNQPEKAKAEFRAAFELDPTNENLLKGYAGHVMAEGDYEGALPLYAQLIRLDPFDGSYFFTMAQLLEKAGREGDAIQAFALAEELSGDLPLADRARRARARLEALGSLPDFVNAFAETPSLVQ